MLVNGLFQLNLTALRRKPADHNTKLVHQGSLSRSRLSTPTISSYNSKIFSSCKTSLPHPSSVNTKVSENSCIVSTGYSSNKDTTIGSSKTDVNIWHKMLGHPSVIILAKVLKKLAYKTDESQLKFCEACKIRKMHQKQHMTVLTKSTNPFQIIFFYLWGHAQTPSYQDYKYYISFVDDFTDLHRFIPSLSSQKQSFWFKTLSKRFSVRLVCLLKLFNLIGEEITNL